jgi:hypothetical protein
MKLGLKRGNTIWSALNRYLLRTQWAHSAIEINGHIYESTALKGKKYRAGVRDYKLIEEDASQFIWVDLGSEKDNEALLRYATIKGHGYDYFSLIPFALPIQVRDAKREYCHEVSLFLMTGIEGKGYKTPEILLFNALLLTKK